MPLFPIRDQVPEWHQSQNEWEGNWGDKPQLILFSPAIWDNASKQ